MKNAIPIILFLFCASCVMAQDAALYDSRKYGAIAEERLKVIDQGGKPIAGARVWGGLQTGGDRKDFISISGTTDMDGTFVICGRCTNRIRCDITKPGYYKSEFIMDNYGYTHGAKNGKWQPFGTTHTIVLKKVNNANLSVPDKRRHVSWNIPKYDEWIPFDLERFDWRKPHGTGDHEDVLIRFTRDKKSNSVFRFTMEVSFTNNAFAGAYVLKKDGSSDFKTIRLADSNETFQSSFHYIRERTADGKRTMTWLGHDEYLVFRTRTTVVDGKLERAHYGCIQGQWTQDLDSMELEDGCFNPTPNDVVIEDGFYLRSILENYGNFRNIADGENQ